MKGRRQVERLVARGRLAVSSNQPDRPLETTFMDAPPAPDERGGVGSWIGSGIGSGSRFRSGARSVLMNRMAGEWMAGLHKFARQKWPDEARRLADRRLAEMSVSCRDVGRWNGECAVVRQ